MIIYVPWKLHIEKSIEKSEFKGLEASIIATQTTQENRNFKTSEIKKDLFEPIQRIRENQEPRPIPITLYKDAGQANKSAGWMPWH